jgi:hypothetical protein
VNIWWVGVSLCAGHDLELGRDIMFLNPIFIVSKKYLITNIKKHLIIVQTLMAHCSTHSFPIHLKIFNIYKLSFFFIE